MTRAPRRIVGTKTGAIAAAVYTSILAVFGSIWFLMRYILRDFQQDEFRIMGYAAFALYGTVLLTSALLLNGIRLNCKRLFSPWLIIMVMVLLFDTGSVSLLTALHLDTQKSLTLVDSVGIVLYCFRMVTHIFSMICVQLYSRQLSVPKYHSQLDEPPSYVSTIEDTLHQPPPPYSALDTFGSNPPPYTAAALNQCYFGDQIPLETINNSSARTVVNCTDQNATAIPENDRSATEAETTTTLSVPHPQHSTGLPEAVLQTHDGS